MKLLAFILSAFLLGVAGGADARDLVIDGWRLPDDHQYRQYDKGAGQLGGQVPVQSVPERIARGEWIYDATARQWLNHPSVGGRNANYYLAGGGGGSNQGSRNAQWREISGDVVWVSPNENRAVVRAQDGNLYDVNLRRAQGDPNLDVGQRVTISGQLLERRRDGREVLRAEQVSLMSGGSTATSQGTNWQRIHGHVQSIQGSRLTFRADDGRLLDVDLNDVNPAVRQGLTQGEGATLIGFASGGNRFDAQYVQQDASDPSRGGTVVGQQPSAPPVQQPAAQQGGWQKLRGTVQSVSGNTLRVKADDGRIMTVDMSQVAANVRGALTQGERVTITGFAGQNANQFTARYVQQEPAPAASPALKK